MADADSSSMKHSNEFWYLDGNVVLIAGEIAFRVFRGQLSQHSDIFRDLFEIPQSSSMEQLDGCPVVRLYDDPNDIIHILRALFPGEHSFSWLMPRPQFAVVSAWIRLGDKYNIRGLRDHGLELLKKIFSDNFPERFGTAEEYLKKAPIEIDIRDAPKVVYLSRLTDTPSLLPLAFYMCCQMVPEDFVGCTTTDIVHERLSADDAVRCLKGADALSHVAIQSCFVVLSEPNPDCTRKGHPDLCSKLLQFHLRVIGLTVGQNRHNLMCRAVLDDREPDLRDVVHNSRVCNACMERTYTKYKEERMRIWDVLPTFFDLEERLADGVLSVGPNS
ncbi:hypothetical protein CERSUDRAFT_140580 [Gelatoporia subvermispora B]|uniref:BTB domain-containing protein n=1 Tax=Ceriporiopsis subvermispora (strain B) TaxID=914234 RepID=M2R743_CERS8|nr:hypothetical protein CERSUDRAFT_140580 [Gelatoporia subvermispora B]